MTKYKSNPGINYGNLPLETGAMPNVDSKTGIRYGVISQNMVLQAWADSSEAEYPCEDCDAWDSDNDCCNDDSFDCEPIAHNYDDEGYKATCSSDGDIFVIASPYYTYAQFCSPCAPGACYLANPVEPTYKANKCYCFGPDWFDAEYEPCPYPVWEVATGKLVYEPALSNQVDK